MPETCVCDHLPDEHDVNGECQAEECPCGAFEMDPDTQTAPEIEWNLNREESGCP